MDLKVNAINFQGKKEVIYGLKKAAQKAKDFEYYKQPAIAMRIRTDNLQTAQNASMQAYLDMVLRDEAFEQTIKEMKISDLRYLQCILMPEQTQHSIVRPMDKLKEAIHFTLNNIGRNKVSLEDAVADLYKKLEL